MNNSTIFSPAAQIFPLVQPPSKPGHDNRMSKQFVNDVVSVTVFVTRWHEVPLPPLEGEVVER